MTEIDRRAVALLALTAPLLASGAFAEPGGSSPVSAETAHGMPADWAGDAGVRWLGDEQIGMLVYPGMTIMDLIGPHCMLATMMGAKIHRVARTLTPVTSDSGVTITPNATLETCPRDLTVLFAPGGTDGTLAAAEDPDTLSFMRDRGSRANYVTSVCSGSLILGAAGLQVGYRATSHWSCRHALKGFGAIPVNERVVRDRNRVTGAGVTSGLDFGLTMEAELRDLTYAQCCQLMSEYAAQPPFHAERLETASPRARRPMEALIADFRQKAEALAARRL